MIHTLRNPKVSLVMLRERKRLKFQLDEESFFCKFWRGISISVTRKERIVKRLNTLRKRVSGKLSVGLLCLLFLGMMPVFSAVRALEVPQIAWGDIQRGSLIGRGGFGEVYAGHWKGQDVAIKVLHVGTLTTAQIQAEFNKEVSMMWACQFPRVVKLYGVCKEPGHCSMIFEQMQRSLHDLIHTGEEISEEKRLQIAIDVAQGLVALHSQTPQILHRDLKSHNILLDKRDRAKISDFGLAKVRSVTSTLTTHRAVGTVRWCAPELLGLRPKFTTAADVYSYGIILWELIARKTPFEDQPNDQIIINAVIAGEREEIPLNCPFVWKEIIESCWQQAPESRPTSEIVLARFLSLKPSQHPVWLPDEEPNPSIIGSSGFVVYPASLGDWQKVLQCYGHDPVPGYDVEKVEVIFNPSMNNLFKEQQKLLQKRQGNPRYTASWQQEGHADLRETIHQQLETLAEPYQDDDCPDVKLLPLWHGTQKEHLDSLLSTGYSPFGDTDDGYFGKGIYATHEAAYAEKYANKFKPTHQNNSVLILNWAITYSSYPILNSDYNPITKKLVKKIPSGVYDSHFIPVIQGTSVVDYIPITPPQTHTYTEMVFFNSAQVLPRYKVTLQPTLPSEPNSQDRVMMKALKEKDDKKKAIALGVSRLVGSDVVIPEVARGYEEVYLRFIKGKLVYRPDDASDIEKIEMPIAALVNPLEGTFDLSKCGDTGKYLSIATGYRKTKKVENKSKLEIWLSPYFLIAKELATTAGHYKAIMGLWDSTKAPLGMFFNWGEWDNLDWYDSLTTNSISEIQNKNLLTLYLSQLKRYPSTNQNNIYYPARSNAKNFMFCL